MTQTIKSSPDHFMRKGSKNLRQVGRSVRDSKEMTLNNIAFIGRETYVLLNKSQAY